MSWFPYSSNSFTSFLLSHIHKKSSGNQTILEVVTSVQIAADRPSFTCQSTSETAENALRFHILVIFAKNHLTLMVVLFRVLEKYPFSSTLCHFYLIISHAPPQTSTQSGWMPLPDIPNHTVYAPTTALMTEKNDHPGQTVQQLLEVIASGSQKGFLAHEMWKQKGSRFNHPHH